MPRTRAAQPSTASARVRHAALGAGALAIAAFVTVGILSYGPSRVSAPLDQWWYDLVLSYRTDAGIVIAWIPAVIGGPIAMLAIGLALVGAFLYLRWRAVAATLASAMVVCVAIASPLAAVVARTRPVDSLAEAVPTSFPSGHTAMAASVVVVLALVFRRTVMWVAGTAWVLVMGWSRTYLHAHWLTDVVAGAFLGTAVGIVVWYAIETLRNRRAAASTIASG
ncbi:undecaprenyl-diphosphatase [Mycetocola sp. CAN_C7]|uniref:phosphatase PAP2 family protein n=1 Tax=Mycetocola sp. CAN_C7 TaxID=2787724 RepID=UPI0018CA2F57